MRGLVLIHGRSQQFKDAAELKKEWMEGLHTGLRNIGSDLQIPAELIRFPYYGQTLFELAQGSDAVPDVVVKGHGEPESVEQDFIAAVVEDVVRAQGIAEEDIRAAADDPSVIARDVQNWPWVIAALRVIDRVPGLSAGSIALVTRDVHRASGQSADPLAWRTGSTRTTTRTSSPSTLWTTCTSPSLLTSRTTAR
ncbi:hypothetical protein [Streptomyces sp. XH2]|uniref:hypothetical protein n=1 Tax=Streptomyces sp. XH2 TaxID=3412483 RepID=UPI003C7C69B8